MKKGFLIALFAMFLYHCKQSDNSIRLEGKVSNSDGTLVVLKPSYDPSYYLHNLVDSTFINHGKFEFQLTKTAIPQPYCLEINGVLTDNFLLGTDQLSVEIDTLYHRAPLKINGLNNAFAKESNQFNQEILVIKKWFGRQSDSIESNQPDLLHKELEIVALRKEFTQKSNEQLLSFVQHHPDSYFAFWKLVSALQWNDYFPEYEETFNNFSKKIKERHAAKVFQKKLSDSKLRAVGGVFPVISVKDTLMQDLTLEIKKLGNTYTLIDFWFSSCRPCIAQFPEYINLYLTFGKKGFEMISISTDNEQNTGFWKTSILKHQLPWANYIDNHFDSVIKMNITKYPTNFLIDNQGKIIARDLSLMELRKFLESNL